MAKRKKASLPDGAVDNLPKATPGQRVKYLLKNSGLTQRELAKRLYGAENVTEAHLSNLNAKLNDKRTITTSDAKEIAKVFDVYPSFILYGGHKNAGDALADAISDMNTEAELLHSAFLALASLAGYKIERLGTVSGDLNALFHSLHEFVDLSDGNRRVTLSIEQLNELENIIFHHAETSIKYYLKAFGKEKT